MPPRLVLPIINPTLIAGPSNPCLIPRITARPSVPVAWKFIAHTSVSFIVIHDTGLKIHQFNFIRLIWMHFRCYSRPYIYWIVHCACICWISAVWMFPANARGMHERCNPDWSKYELDNFITYFSFEILKVVKIYIAVFLAMTTCSLVGGNILTLSSP
jgi:hypothetical protein